MKEQKNKCDNCAFRTLCGGHGKDCVIFQMENKSMSYYKKQIRKHRIKINSICKHPKYMWAMLDGKIEIIPRYICILEAELKKYDKGGDYYL